jgi:hypothetical protein
MGKKPFTPEQRERRRAYVKAWRAEHREHSPPANRNGEVPHCPTMARTAPTVGDTLGRPAEVAESSNRRGHQPACGLSRELPYPVVHLIPGIKGWVGSAINCNRARPLAES